MPNEQPRLQFDIGSLLLATTVCAVLLALVAAIPESAPAKAILAAYFIFLATYFVLIFPARLRRLRWARREVERLEAEMNATAQDARQRAHAAPRVTAKQP